MSNYYDINTLEELKERIEEMKVTQPDMLELYTLEEIIEDAYTVGLINPEVNWKEAL